MNLRIKSRDDLTVTDRSFIKMLSDLADFNF